ncbi:MAG: hypothetical protein A2900_04030 [Candidatus Chisholmbacteria bacterium RIFCSPLOWO2_01_FULL_50_28]|uniref:CBS domain-containing protein n=1 Tax=Candidatus Chisholmbacteria bacterium RIFCSPHIGHO2_01_FULL_52_32 TaxID=1797591 RepID=A0A1G1VSL2_9BACT|nr:MAG: hypothetical protein A2786_02715 [Candidatus Chisholmbacteria bacterium RIFCSPHIGHO2_01_FULL_52_32]OGY20238.1 MAG: hypothetical protein A2900_04030 [Candidatus Chisholmbacteria bacterium RIFCSPLOWO2_01_FULL_50_28]
MKVLHLMSKNPISATPNIPFKDVWKLIFEKRISGLPITGKGHQLVGIISEEDLIERLYPSYEQYFFDPLSAKNFEEMEKNLTDVSKLRAKDVMNKNVFTTTEETPIMKAASVMLVNRVSCLPVIKTKKGMATLIGIICKGDIFGQLFRSMRQKK